MILSNVVISNDEIDQNYSVNWWRCCADWLGRYFAAFTTPSFNLVVTTPDAFYRPPCDYYASLRWTDTTAISVCVRRLRSTITHSHSPDRLRDVLGQWDVLPALRDCSRPAICIGWFFFMPLKLKRRRDVGLGKERKHYGAKRRGELRRGKVKGEEERGPSTCPSVCLSVTRRCKICSQNSLIRGRTEPLSKVSTGSPLTGTLNASGVCIELLNSAFSITTLDWRCYKRYGPSSVYDTWAVH